MEITSKNFVLGPIRVSHAEQAKWCLHQALLRRLDKIRFIQALLRIWICGKLVMKTSKPCWERWTRRPRSPRHSGGKGSQTTGDEIVGKFLQLHAVLWYFFIFVNVFYYFGIFILKMFDLMIMGGTVGEPLPLIVTISQERLLTLGTKYIYKIYYWYKL